MHTHIIKHLLLTVLLSFVYLAAGNAACGDIRLTFTLLIPTTQTHVFNLPPQFTDINVECDTNALTLCTTNVNVADETIVLDETTAHAYANMNDYNFLRLNKSIFPNFDNQLVLTPTFMAPGGNGFGRAVAISGNGSTVAIGSQDTSTTIYSVDIYQRRNNTWVAIQHLTQPPGIPKPLEYPGSSPFGSALALSYDGSVLAVGGIPFPVEQEVAQEYVFIYTYNNTIAAYELLQTIPGSPASGFGNFLDLSADGKYLLVGNSNNLPNASSTRTNAAWIYVRSSSCNPTCAQEQLWEKQTFLLPITPDGNLATTSLLSDTRNFAKNVALSADGTTAAIGCPRTLLLGSGLSGIVAIFTRINTTWQQSYIIIPPSGVSGLSPDFGTSVALSANGTYLAVSEIREGGLFPIPRNVYIFAKRGNTYEQDALLSMPLDSVPTFRHRFGQWLSFSADGTTLAIGEGYLGTSSTYLGGIHIAVRGPDNQWTLPFAIVDNIGTALGTYASCSGDGAFVVTGAPEANSSQGQVFIFRSTGSFVPNDTVVTGTLCVYKRTTIDAALKVAGNIHLNNAIITGTGLVTACTAVLSDKHTKNNITTLDPAQALATLRALHPVTFVWKDTAHNTSDSQTGFIAQHMREIFPHWVNKTPATQHDATFLQGDSKYMITIKAELYAYLVAALERLMQKNKKQREEIDKIAKPSKLLNI